MFTGIIEETGKIRSVVRKKDRQELSVYSKTIPNEVKVGDSVSVNGVCLTVTGRVLNDLKVDVVPESLSKSTISGLKVGDLVNLERAMKAEGRFDGHIVSGHVDSRSTVIDIQKNDRGTLLEIVIPGVFSKYIIDKGSIAIDGVSLTIAKTKRTSFVVAVIPHTYEHTNLKYKKAGDLVNLEFDALGKYVEKMLESRLAGELQGASNRTIDLDFLRRTGFLN